jgi:hypothetical protein
MINSDSTFTGISLWILAIPTYKTANATISSGGQEISTVSTDHARVAGRNISGILLAVHGYAMTVLVDS